MRRSPFTGFVLAILLSATLVSPSIAAPPVGTGVPFVITMTGDAEVPGPGDPDGNGTATLRLNPGREMVCWHIVTSDIEPATAAHIHRGPVDTAGPVVVPLMPGEASNEWDGCVDADRGLIFDIIRNPEEYYVNVHNAEFPSGAVRGQLG